MPEEIQDQPQIGIGELIKPARAAMVVSGILTALGAVLKLAPFVAFHQLAVRWLDDGFNKGAAWDNVWGWAAIAVGGLLLGQLCYLIGLGITHGAEVNLRAYLRNRVLTALARLPLGKVAQIPRGTIRKMVVDDTTAIHTLVAHAPGDTTNAAISVIAGVAYLLWVDWRFSLALFGFLAVLIAIVLVPALRGYGNMTVRFGEAQTDLAAASVEMLEGIEEIKNFQAAEASRTRFNAARDRFTEISYEWSDTAGRAVSLLGALLRPSSVSVIIALLSALFVTQNWMSLADTLLFFLIAPAIPDGLTTMLTLWQHLYTSMLASQTTGALLAQPPMREGKKELADVADASVELEQVSFGYNPDEQVIHEVSLVAKPGTVTAIVGASGSGKSTLGLLMARFYDVDEGSVKIGGVDVRNLSFEALLSSVSIVLQEVALSNDTVFENIALGTPGATREQVEEAAKIAQIHDRIMEMPQGYDTVLGSKGGFLSGGERQRVALARTCLQDTPILILDEATAQADPDAERLIYQALSEMARNRTVIVIAHRLSTIQDADQIVVLDSGRIVEQGTHEDLLASQGRYASLWSVMEN